jgi:hypothetical protein
VYVCLSVRSFVLFGLYANKVCEYVCMFRNAQSCTVVAVSWMTPVGVFVDSGPSGIRYTARPTFGAK